MKRNHYIKSHKQNAQIYKDIDILLKALTIDELYLVWGIQNKCLAFKTYYMGFCFH